MRLGGLFSGVGGFELAWQQLGHEVAWMCEVDSAARRVLAARFPDTPIYEDVRDLDPQQVEAVDVLTGGSPCQGFSVVGTRTGLSHSESTLFSDYVRIVDGLAERGLQYAIWENVPGVLSIEDEDEERTFEHVVAALAGGAEPVRLRRDKRWNTGMAAGRRRAVAWRVLDSRYFGVAQRRRRVFACVAFGDAAADRAGRTLLAVAKGVRRNTASCEEEQRAPTVSSVRRDETSRWGNGSLVAAYGMHGSGGNEGAIEELQPAITASHGQPGNVATLHTNGYELRRLTPIECERLQSFPEGWTEAAGSDAARYKAMGNAVTVNVARWILQRAIEAIEITS